MSEKTLMAHVEFSHHDLTLMQNALNEVLNGLPLSEFETRLGGTRKEVLELQDHVQDVAKKLLIGEAARIASKS
jgi:transcriptional regulator of heat shock response